jgi:hypothetical protein
MGAKTWMLVYADEDARKSLANQPTLDRDSTIRLAAQLFPDETLEPLDDGDLLFACPPNKELMIGCFPGVSVLAAKEFGIDNPSKLHRRFIEAGTNKTITLHAMHSVVDWFAFAQWRNGQLVRSLSLSPDSGIIEDIGPKFEFEKPYWAGQRSAVDEDEEHEDSYPLPFHPLDMAEDALKELFGYQLEGFIDPSLLEPESIPLARFRRKRAWWKFGR